MAYLPTVRTRAIILLFFSGAAALVYQILWVKQLALVVGVDVYAVTHDAQAVASETKRAQAPSSG